MYNFKDEYRIGVEQLDLEHEKLFEIADKHTLCSWMNMYMISMIILWKY